MSRGRSSSGFSSRGSSSSSSSRSWSLSSSSRGRSTSSLSSSRGSSSSNYRASRFRTGPMRRSTIIINNGDYSYNGGNYNGNAGKVVLIFIGLTFLICGIFLGISGINDLSSQNTLPEYETVIAKCIDNEYRAGWYYARYEYTVDSREYVSTSQEGWELPEREGDYVFIYYMVDNPYVITEEKPIEEHDSPFGMLATAAVCCFIGVTMIVFGAKMKSHNSANNTEYSSTESNDASTQSNNQTIYCQYCGSSYNSVLHTCPNCGANRRDRNN